MMTLLIALMGLGLLFLVLFVWSLCRAASDADHMDMTAERRTMIINSETRGRVRS
jgi:hypothetical protein